jgi:hypothetical protein
LECGAFPPLLFRTFFEVRRFSAAFVSHPRGPTPSLRFSAAFVSLSPCGAFSPPFYPALEAAGFLAASECGAFSPPDSIMRRIPTRAAERKKEKSGGKAPHSKLSQPTRSEAVKNLSGKSSPDGN